MSMRVTVDALLEFYQIQQLKYRYLRAIDTHQWDLLETCFTEGARVWYAGGRYSYAGRSEIMKFLQGFFTDSVVSSHIVTHPELELTGLSTAKGVWRLQDTVHFLDANPVYAHANILGGEEMNGAAYYYDDYIKEADGWKISSTGFERMFEAIEPRSGRVGFRLEPGSSLGVHVDRTIKP